MELGTKFSALRKQKHLSVYKLAKHAEVSENYIHTIEKNASQPSIYILEKLLTCLGVTLSEFFSESEQVSYLSPYEIELIAAVRTLDEERATAVLRLAQLL